MACFIVPASEAIISSIVQKTCKTKEGKDSKKESVIPFSRKLKWLNNMLWGGTALLAFEHVWHGEVVPFFPFLTAASNPQDASEMLQEMSTAGVTMALLVTGVWVGMLIASHFIEKRPLNNVNIENA